jgi:hypothetical protein
VARAGAPRDIVTPKPKPLTLPSNWLRRALRASRLRTDSPLRPCKADTGIEALAVFFPLLISLSEHVALAVAVAYLAAASACTALRIFYGLFVLHSLRAGAAFSAGVAALYGALCPLLQPVRPTKALRPSPPMRAVAASPAASGPSATRAAGAARSKPHSLPASANSQMPGSAPPKRRPRLT